MEQHRIGDLEDVYGKLRHESAEIEGHSQDLHHLQQDLQRHDQSQSVLIDWIKRDGKSVQRLIEENRMLRKHNEDFIHEFKSLYRPLQSLLQSLLQYLLSSQKKTAIEDVKERDIIIESLLQYLLSSKKKAAVEDGKEREIVVDEAMSSCATTGTTEEESDYDGDAAKILIDLSAQEKAAANSPKSRQLSVETVQTQLEPVETQGLGCRFQPTDQELIQFLKDKIAGKNIPMHIRERNLYGSEEPATIFNGNPAGELYFVTQIRKKFDSGKKNSRVVGNGTWKIQNNKNVYEDPSNKKKIIGEKRALNFIDENTKKDKISWIMHEYNLCSAAENPERWTICRIKRGKGNRIGLALPQRPIENANDDKLQVANDEDSRVPKKRPVLDTANDDDELTQPKKRRVLEMLDLSLSLGRPSEKTVAPRNCQKDHKQNLFEHSMSSPPWDTFL